MTGPPYPHPVLPPGSFDFWTTIISQYANSPVLTQLISDFAAYVDQATNFDDFFRLIWNVDTAQGEGLNIWGRIVGVQRTLHVPNAGDYFGYFEAQPGSQPFNQAPFYTGDPLTTNFSLADDPFRVLIFAKALANISDGSIPAVNQLLLNLFPGRGNVFVTDGLNMSMTYTFQFALTPVELAIVSQSGVLPKPVGVSATVVVPP